MEIDAATFQSANVVEQATLGLLIPWGLRRSLTLGLPTEFDLDAYEVSLNDAGTVARTLAGWLRERAAEPYDELWDAADVLDSAVGDSLGRLEDLKEQAAAEAEPEAPPVQEEGGPGGHPGPA